MDNSNDLKILLIDDDEDDAFLFTEAISEIDPRAEVTVFSEWKKVFSYVETLKVIPHIIFMDYILPGKRGNELASELHKNRKLKNVPVVLCSGLSEPLSGHENKDVREMITKPSTYQKLVDLLRKVLQKNVTRKTFPLKRRQMSIH